MTHTKHRRRWLRGLLWGLIAATAAGLLWLFANGWVLYREAVEATPLDKMVASVRAREDYVSLDETPEIYRQAVIAVEDHRYYHHGAIDPIAIVRAVWHDLRAGSYVEGGSTITQQLAKNLYFTQEKNFVRKIAELFAAMDFESRYSKEEILELYLNTIYFGSGYYGVKDACEGYFGIEPGAMSDGQATLLAGIPNAPSVYSLDANPALACQRQRQVLNKMVEYGFLSAEEADAVAESPLSLQAAA